VLGCTPEGGRDGKGGGGGIEREERGREGERGKTEDHIHITFTTAYDFTYFLNCYHD
jgi:hypothetical protein